MGELSVCVCVDSDGNYGVGQCEQSARDHYEEQVGALSEVDGFRIIDLTVNVPLPVPIEATINVPQADETAAVTVK